MQKKLKWLYITLIAAFILSVGVYILLLQEKYQRLQNKYMEQALTHVGHIYVHKLNKYKADNGRYPDSLVALFPNYIAKLNLLNIYTPKLVLEEKCIVKDLTPKQRSPLQQLNAPKCSLWDDWHYALDHNDNTFKLDITYEDSKSRNTLQYIPELDTFPRFPESFFNFKFTGGFYEKALWNRNIGRTGVRAGERSGGQEAREAPGQD